MTEPPTLESPPSTAGHVFVFLCGLHRSGRSVMHRILKEHPEISVFHNTGVPDDEGEYLQGVYPKSRNFGGPGKFCFSPDSYLTETSRLVTDENRRRLFSQWAPYWDMDRKFLVEKSAPNLISSRFLQAMFPNSVFIFLVRHPVAVALATQKTALYEMPEYVEHWSLAHKAMLADREHLRRHILVRYEDMVARPDHCMKLVYDFLQIPSQPVTEKLLPAINKEYFKLWEEYKLAHSKVYGDVMAHAGVPAQFRYLFDQPYVHPTMIHTGTVNPEAG